MGQSISCFRSANKNNSARNKKNNEDDMPTANQLKQWKKLLGFQDETKIIQFDYPIPIKHNSFKQIEKDINRTFPDSAFFKKKENQQTFEEVLRKFTVYFPKTGYTQGVNFITGYLLMAGCNSDQVFTMLSKICTHYDLMCIGLYQDDFPLNRAYCAVLWEILADKLPILTQKVKQMNLPDDLWIFQWFMTFFIYSFPLYTIKDFLGFIFQQKKMSSVKLAYGIISQISKIMIKLQQDIDFLELCQNLKSRVFCKKNLNISNILNIASSIKDEQMQQYISRAPLLNNFYRLYFLSQENDRKLKSVNISNRLHQERKQFLSQPDSLHFSRNQNEITVIDSLQLINYRMYTSLVNQHKRAPISENFSQQSTRMWASDLIHMENVVKKQQKSMKNQVKSFAKIQEEEKDPIRNFKKKK